MGEDLWGLPRITPFINDIEDGNGWYISDITVSWEIDTENEVYEKEGCDTITISYDTEGVPLTC